MPERPIARGPPASRLRAVVWGLTAGCVAVVLYAMSTVLQASAAKAADQLGTVGALTSLVESPAWWAGLACLGVAFGCFAVSTQLLSLPVAEAIRSTYVVLAVLLGHLVFRTRATGREILGVLIAVAASTLFVAMAADRGTAETPTSLVWVMLIVLAVVAAFGVAVRRVELHGTASRLVGSAFAALAGICFALLAVGLRSLESLTDVPGVLTSGAAWLAGVSALFGLVLFAGAAAATTLAVATTVLVMFEVTVSSVLAMVDFGDAAGTAPAVWALCGVGLLAGAVLVVGSADPGPARFEQPEAAGPISTV